MTDIVTTIYAYTGDHGLNFQAGERINVLERGENGWWRGTLVKDGDSTDGKPEMEGWFPSSYVEKRDENEGSVPNAVKSPTTPKSSLPLNWRATKSPDGRTYYYNEITNETTWSPPEGSSPTKSPPATFPKRHTISHSSSVKKPTSPTVKTNENPLSQSATVERPDIRSNSSASNLTVDSGYNGSIGSPSPTSSRESIDAKSVGSTGSGGQRRRRKTMLTLTPSRPLFFTYPTIDEGKEQSLLSQLEVSFCDNFWEDLGESTGFDIVRGFIQKGKANCKEMAEFFKERAAIEEKYAKKLSRLSHGPHGNHEKGSCGETWQKLKKCVDDEANYHYKFSASILNGLEKTLTEYSERPIFVEKKDTKRADVVLQEDRKKVESRFKDVEQQRAALAERQAKLGLLSKPQDISKAQKKMAAAVEDLKRSIDEYNDVQRKWIDDMVLALMELEKRETERIQFIQKKLEMYTELGKNTFDQNSQTMTKLLEAVGKIDPAIDRKAFVDGNRTGTIRPVDMKK